MDHLLEWIAAIVEAVIPRRFDRLLTVLTLLVVGATCLGFGGWFLYRVGSGEGQALFVPATLFGGVGLLCVAFAVRAARRG